MWGFVDKWDELIDWERRAEREGDFFIQQLQEAGSRQALDVATGTGFHSVRLLKAGELMSSVQTAVHRCYTKHLRMLEDAVSSCALSRPIGAI